MEFDRQDTIAEIDQAGTGVLLDDVLRGCGSGARRLPAEIAQGFEWAELPAESPAHGVVHIPAVMRDFGCDALGIFERRNQRRAQKLADLVLAIDQRSNSLADVFD